MTKNRKMVLDTLKKAEGPLNASQIHEKCGFGPDLATIYRNLQALEKEGLADSFVFDCQARGVERYYTAHSIHHTHYLHCEDCHNFIPLDSCMMEQYLYKIESQYRFKIAQHFFTVTGQCQNCSPAE